LSRSRASGTAPRCDEDDDDDGDGDDVDVDDENMEDKDGGGGDDSDDADDKDDEELTVIRSVITGRGASGGEPPGVEVRPGARGETCRRCGCTREVIIADWSSLLVPGMSDAVMLVW
jgi:hypothetical protein